MTDFQFDLIATVVKLAVLVGGLMGAVSGMTWIERRVSAIIQYRLGPNRVGPFGLLQPIADGIKFIMKQDIMPSDAHKPFYALAPALALMTALCAFAVIPIGPVVELFGHRVGLAVVDLDGGLLFAFAATSLGVYGIVLAGWASRSKFSLIGGLRSTAQMISYELPLVLAFVSAVLVAGTLRPYEIVEQQAGWFWNWNVFSGAQLLAFAIFVIAGFAETNRLPFDLPEAEAELVAGYHTEYSSMKFAMFFMAEYINMITSSALCVTLFLGGYHLGFPVSFEGPALWILQVLAFVGKVALFQFVFVWVRWTLPRFRYDQLMFLGWKRLLPLSLVNLAVVAVLVALGVAPFVKR